MLHSEKHWATHSGSDRGYHACRAKNAVVRTAPLLMCGNNVLKLELSPNKTQVGRDSKTETDVWTTGRGKTTETDSQVGKMLKGVIW